MKKFLRMFLLSCMCFFLLGGVSFVYSEMTQEEFEEHVRKTQEDVKNNITKEMTDEFKQTDLYKQIKNGPNRRKQWYNTFMSKINEAGKKDAKMAKLEKLLKDLRPIVESHEVDLDKSWDLLKEAMAIKPLSILHHYKACIYARRDDYGNFLKEEELVKENVRPMMEYYYMSVGNIKNELGDKQGALQSYNEGVKNDPSMELFDCRSRLNKELGNYKAYEEDRKIVLLLVAINQMGY